MIVRSILLLLLLLLPARGQDDSRFLHLLCWSEYVPQTVIDQFTKTSGISVQTQNYQSNEEMVARLRRQPGYFDLIQPSGFYVHMLSEAGALEPLDPARLPNLANLDPRYRHLVFDPQGKFSVPWLAGSVGIVVNTRRVNRPIESWEDVFNGESRGRIVVVDDGREMVAWALAASGRPISDVTDQALQAVEPILQRWLPQVAVFDSNDPKAAMLDGRAEVGIMWSGEAALLWEKDHAYRFVLPKVGAHRFVDNLAIPKGAPHQAAAHAFINFCLKAKVSAMLSAAYPYTNPNAAARKLLSRRQLENPASYPPGEADLPMLRNQGNTTEAVTAFVKRLRSAGN